MNNEDLSLTPNGELDQLANLYDEEFVAAAYQVILGRPPDAGGFRNYLAQVRTGADRMLIVAEMARSPEGRGRRAVPGMEAFIKRYARQRDGFWSRLLGRSQNRRLLALERQLRVMDNHLYLVNRALTKRLEDVYLAISVAPPPIVVTAAKKTEAAVSIPMSTRRSGTHLRPALGRTFAELTDAIAARR